MKKLYLSDVDGDLAMVYQLTKWNYKYNGGNTAIGYIKGIPVIFKWDLKQMHIHCTSEDWQPLKTRLLDMDVERYLLGSALTAIISQRLCKKQK